MPQAGEGHVGPGQPPALLRGKRQQALPCLHGLFVVRIRLKRSRWVGKLHRLVVHHVAPQQQLLQRRSLRIPIDQKGAVAYCVPSRWHIAHPCWQRIAFAEGMHTLGTQIRCQCIAGHGKQRFEQGCGGLFLLRVYPVLQLIVVEPDLCLRIGHVAFGIQQAAQMVWVRMGQQYMLHRCRRHARRTQVGQHLAQVLVCESEVPSAAKRRRRLAPLRCRADSISLDCQGRSGAAATIW